MNVSGTEILEWNEDDSAFVDHTGHVYRRDDCPRENPDFNTAYGIKCHGVPDAA